VSFAPAVHANFLTAISREFHLGIGGGSMYLSLNFWGALASIAAAGPMAGRFGSRRVLVAAWLLQLFAVTMIGLAAWPLMAYAGVFAASIGFGAISVLVPHTVSGLYPERRTRAMSLMLTFYTLGALAANLLVLLLIRLGASWRIAYLAVSAMALPWGFMELASGASPDELPRRDASASLRVGARPAAPPASALAVGMFLALCVAQAASSAAEVSTSMWIPTFLTTTTGASASFGPVSLLLFCVAGAAGKLLNAAAVGRVDMRVLLATGLALFTAGLLLAIGSRGPGAALAGFCVAGLGTGGFSPAVTVRMAELFPHASATRYSLFMAIGNLGPIGGPVLIGMAAAGDLRRGMLTMLPAAALCCGLLFLIRTPRGSLGRR
jgi:MFS family permease